MKGKNESMALSERSSDMSESGEFHWSNNWYRKGRVHWEMKRSSTVTCAKNAGDLKRTLHLLKKGNWFGFTAELLKIMHRAPVSAAALHIEDLLRGILLISRDWLSTGYRGCGSLNQKPECFLETEGALWIELRLCFFMRMPLCFPKVKRIIPVTSNLHIYFERYKLNQKQ